MSPSFATFLLMNNYFHDVATAMLLACCVVLWTLLKRLGDERDRSVLAYGRALYRGVAGMFWFSVAWIAASGVIRIATFRSFEWFNTTQKHFEAGLLVKYAIATVMTVLGAVLWLRLSRRMKQKLDSPS